MVKYPYKIIAIALLIVSCGSILRSAAQSRKNFFPLPPDSKAIRESDIEPLLNMIGKRRIIATTEANHGMNEPLDFRNALMKLLVRKKIIDVVVIESGITESRLLYDYVLGGEGSINDVLYDGLSWQFHVLPQNEQMVEWLRLYNADPKNSHKVKVYGFDMPGSPTNPLVHRKMNTALIAVLEYLEVVDSAGYSEFSTKLGPYVPYLHVNFAGQTAAEKQYIDLTAGQREKLNLNMQELIQYMEVQEIEFTVRSSREDYEWAYQSALNARHTLNLANYIPLDYKVLPDEELEASDFLRNIVRYRDRVMFDNIEWILGREPHSRILLFAGTGHLLKIPVNIALDSGRTYRRECAGNFLNLRYKNDYLVIGNLVAGEDEGMIEHKLIDDQHQHYYLSLLGGNNHFLFEGSKLLNYRSKNMTLDVANAIDILLFDRSQTTVQFRGN